jgi:hypothetical protein
MLRVMQIGGSSENPEYLLVGTLAVGQTAYLPNLVLAVEAWLGLTEEVKCWRRSKSCDGEDA